MMGSWAESGPTGPTGWPYGDRADTADAWRGSIRAVDEHIYWIRNHLRVIAAGTENAGFIADCRESLAYRARLYREALRDATEFAEILGRDHG